MLSASTLSPITKWYKVRLAALPGAVVLVPEGLTDSSVPLVIRLVCIGIGVLAIVLLAASVPLHRRAADNGRTVIRACRDGFTRSATGASEIVDRADVGVVIFTTFGRLEFQRSASTGLTSLSWPPERPLDRFCPRVSYGQ